MIASEPQAQQLKPQTVRVLAVIGRLWPEFTALFAYIGYLWAPILHPYFASHHGYSGALIFIFVWLTHQERPPFERRGK
jgi:hypothetical protein